MDSQEIGFVSSKQSIEGTRIEDVINSYKSTLGDGVKVTDLTFTSNYDASRDGYNISVSNTSGYQKIPNMKGNATITVSDNTTADPNNPGWKWVQTPNIWTTPNTLPGSSPYITPMVYPDDGSSVELLGAPAELSEESKALLKSVEEKVSELLGKHPYARYANMRKALDEFLKEKGGRFEGCYLVDCLDGREGWMARYSTRDPDHQVIETDPMPTEIEAIAEMIRMVM